VAVFAFLGALLGVRTLFMVLSYGARHSHEAPERIAPDGE
jgi:hypothetical protein